MNFVGYGWIGTPPQAFFLDDYKGWLDLKGEIASIIAIDFSLGPAGPKIRVVIAEAKYVGQDSLMEQHKTSVSQHESTFTAISYRLLDMDVRKGIRQMHLDALQEVGLVLAFAILASVNLVHGVDLRLREQFPDGGVATGVTRNC